jgi:septal ring factor EnvC (AmiA/AmiB activator)
MKKIIFIFLLSVALGSTAFFITRSLTSKCDCRLDPHTALVIDQLPELEWLRKDLKLTDQQFGEIKEQHLAYRPTCMKMCHQIAETHKKLNKLANENNMVSHELELLLQQHADIHVEGQKALLSHLYATASVLNTEQKERYLKEMLPYAIDFSHQENDD